MTPTSIGNCVLKSTAEPGMAVAISAIGLIIRPIIANNLGLFGAMTVLKSHRGFPDPRVTFLAPKSVQTYVHGHTHTTSNIRRSGRQHSEYGNRIPDRP